VELNSNLQQPAVQELMTQLVRLPLLTKSS
jgi:hypothetical protein